MRRTVPIIGVLMLVALVLTVAEGNVLYRIQEQNLFLHTTLFFRQCMVTAGGLLTWTGAYLTQYLYYPMLGAGVLCLLWAFLAWMLTAAFRLPAGWQPMALVPVACLLIANTDLGYWIYFLKLRGYFFDATVGTIAAVAMVWCYRSLPRRAFVRTLFVPVATTLGYILFGFYGLWGALLMAIMAWRTDSRRLADSLAAIASAAIVPLVCYHTLYHETNIVNIYWTGLPIFAFRQTYFTVYYLPYVALFVSVALMAGGYGMKSRRPLKAVQWGVLLATALCVMAFWYKDDNFHREQSMCRSMEQQQWEQVLATAKGAKGEPTRAMCMMQNLALYRLGRLGTDMFKFPNGAKRPNAPFSLHTVHTQGKMLYLQYGLPNYCHRWCMEDGVEYGWSVEKLRLMALCALLNREPQAALHFINLLGKTTFHKDWAQRHKALVANPALTVRDPELAPILPLLRDDNFLTADQSQLEMFLIEHLLSSPGHTREQQELARLTMQYYRNNPKKIVEQ